MNRIFLAASGLVLALFLFTACDSSTDIEDSQTAHVQILMTDAPADYIEEAWVSISRVFLIPGEEDPEEGPPFVELFNDADNPLEYDLLTLQDGVTADLTGEQEVPAGQYNQLRLIVADATITLKDGFEFADGTTTKSLTIPSGAQSGIKVMLDEPISSDAGTINVILVDFDVDQNFVIQGNPDNPAGIQGILFTPVLRELQREVDES